MQNDATKATGRAVRGTHTWKGKRWQLCWVGGKDRSSLKSVMAELNFQGGIHQMDQEGRSIHDGGCSTHKSSEVQKRMVLGWGPRGAWDMGLNGSPGRAVGIKSVAGVPG